ncbi:MAG TPA: methyltransferase [Bryobacteraceae bacterium]|jgi:trans-aconitate methyltransferase
MEPTLLPDPPNKMGARVSDEATLAKMRGLIFGFSITRSIAVAAELGLADLLVGGPRTVAELARECEVFERPLYRMLRALAGENIFVEEDDGRFALTPMAELLRTDHPSSLRDWAIYLADLPYRSSFEMLHSLRTGESAFRKAFGSPIFEYVATHAEYATKLFRAMSSISAARIAGLLDAYDFSGITRLVDLGGAHGSMTAAIAKRYPTLRCTCFDLSSAEQGALKTFRDHDVSDRCDFLGGDFFENVPAGADAYLISAVLHDWNDQRCLQILRNCRDRVADSGSLLIIDIVLSDKKNVPDTYRNFLDLATLTQTEGGMERRESQFRDLLKSAGFHLNRIIPMKAPQCVIEALPQ